VLAWVTLLPLYFVFIVMRSRAPSDSIAIPSDCRVAMVVTKVPSEPFPLVRRTLEAMLSQPYPHDTWLADEDPSEETIEWCRQHDVKISTRRGCSEYHKPDWPRRTRCKEGNLAYFYDHYGYQNYDFVVQLDADHVPSDNYLEEMLRPFADPTVGYVSAPSICDNNAQESWSARGRLYVEGALHGALQAGYNGGLAPLCIGSHYAVRTTALKSTGGLGPELAEDHSTTLMMNAHGWRGVHAVNAIAGGDGPQTFPDLAMQEFQWSRSLTAILLNYTPKYIGKLPTKLKFQFLFSQIWYPLFSLMFLIMYLMPLGALFFDQAYVHIEYPYFFLYSAALAALLVLMTTRLRAFGVLRPSGAKILSWEGLLFLFARWPWSLIGTCCAIFDYLRQSSIDFRVTPKSKNGVEPVPLRVLAPYAALCLTSGLAVIFLEAASAPGYYIFALINCVIYSAVLSVIVVRHALESGHEWLPRSMSELVNARALLMAAVLIVPMTGLARVPAALESLLWMDDAPHRSETASIVGPVE
jgi:cellulose synthase (UDP-forming)